MKEVLAIVRAAQSGICSVLFLYKLRKMFLVGFFFFLIIISRIKILHVEVGKYSVTKCLCLDK